MARYLGKLGLVIAGIAAFVAVSVILDHVLGVSFEVFYRVACGAACLGFIWKLGRDYPSESWPRTGLWLAAAVNLAIFFTPLVERPTSRGEIMIFALPSAVIVLGARLAFYRVTDEDQRAARQVTILSFVVAALLCCILYAFILLALSSH